MPIRPVARYMLLCEGWRFEDKERRRLTIVGLMTTLRPTVGQDFPLRHEEFCVCLGLAGGRGEATGQVIGVYEETGQRVFGTHLRPYKFSNDPLEVLGVGIRVRGALFQKPGSYLIQFWYDAEMVVETSLLVRMSRG